MSRRAKIVCTLGPATSSPERIRELVEAGMDIARLNLSHGSHEQHAQTYQQIRAASDAVGRSVGILVDLQGPKIRLGKFGSGPVTLASGDRFTITTDDVLGDQHRVGTTFSGLTSDVTAGDRILVDDGRLVLEVVEVAGSDVHTTVIVGGPVSNHKGMNIPGAALGVPALTDKDAEDLRFGLGLPADMIALSFVRSAADVEKVRAVMDEVGVRLPVLAKIEKPQAVDQLEEIVEAFDGLMIARGDLGVELPLQVVPLVQKRGVSWARERAKPVIVATQVLESMVHAPRPTRAEASDCANAVLDGADAIMLSAETSVGEYPVEAVATMARIIETAETDLGRLPPLRTRPRTVGGALAEAAANVGSAMGARYLVAFSQSGDTARRLARYRSPIPLLAFTPVPAVRSQLALLWGVETFLVPFAHSTDEMVRQVDSALLQLERCKPGELVVVVAGTPPGVAGMTNTIRVHRIGEEV
ncbi:pyruvate kinase [Protofrankia sp. BMG5.30]|uniref:pyruvate kinase n=1 Tax=Protofrankia sp. BMG5.30 TaxID=1834514 RepID=UPI0009775D1B|nr:pyruvate kinase [Protofrankia sp. BMG5.30]ONH36762.1 pyruvate kinase [Protofrankia sp. BMG5.30]